MVKDGKGYALTGGPRPTPVAYEAPYFKSPHCHPKECDARKIPRLPMSEIRKAQGRGKIRSVLDVLRRDSNSLSHFCTCGSMSLRAARKEKTEARTMSRIVSLLVLVIAFLPLCAEAESLLKLSCSVDIKMQRIDQGHLFFIQQVSESRREAVLTPV